jgi:ArsR family transcriptional regulator, arsenate/arsenite/antimonite-responsive transcriptional repressor
MNDVIKTFKTLSDETRLRILCLLMKRECCVCEVMQVLRISQTRASRNLAALYDAGFLKVKKEGLWSLYYISPDADKEYLKDLVKVVAEAVGNTGVITRDRERLEKAERLAPECLQNLDAEISDSDKIAVR